MKKNKKSPPSFGKAELRRGEAGQVLLIVILVMVVALTVGLSVITRSITTIRTSKEEASSQKALAAAEAGIEELLKANTAVPLFTDSVSPNTTYTASSTNVLGTSLLVSGGNSVPKDDGADIWLVAHNPDGTPNLSSPWSGNLTIYWGDTPVSCNNAAVEIVVVYDPPPHKFKHFAFDPCGSRASNNNFSSASGGGSVSGKTFFHSTSVIVVTSGFVARAVPLYKNTPIGVVASIALPSQGIVIDSTGDSGGTKRKINVFKGYPQLPIQYFSYGLFSP